MINLIVASVIAGSLLVPVAPPSVVAMNQPIKKVEVKRPIRPTVKKVEVKRPKRSTIKKVETKRVFLPTYSMKK
jgi:hypothetical protein